MPMTRSLLIILISLFSFLQGNAQLSLETFGKNRVQRKKMDWRYFESERFRVYYYDRGGAELARFVSEQADQDVKAIERSLNSNFPEMLNIIIYNNYDEYLQTNIDFNTELEVSDPYAGNVKVAGDKLVIYFTGKHNDLKRQLRRGMAQVIMERALFGDDVKSFAKNVLTQKIPTWISAGYIDYTVFGWDAESEEEWKQLVAPEKVAFDRLVASNEDLAGRAFWKYINDKHGKTEVRNLFFYILQKNNLNSALKQRFGIKKRQINDSIIAHFKARYEFESQLADNPNGDDALFKITRSSEDVTVREIKVSPRGSDVAYVEWEHGEYKVILEKTAKQKKTKLDTRGILHRGGLLDFTADPDLNYPLLAWSNTGFKLGILYPKYGKLYIRIYDAIAAKHTTHEIKYNRFDRIQGITFMEDDNLLVLSAIRNGQSDLYEYRYRTGQFTQLTDDTYDDFSPVFITGGARKGIAFLSNRPLPLMNIRTLPNELPTQAMNAFFYFHTTKSPNLLQLTYEKEDRVNTIIPFGPDYYAYLSDKSGIQNRYVVLFNRDGKNMDTAYSVPVTNYSSNIITQQYNAASGKIAEVIQKDNQYKIFFRDVQLPAPVGDAPVKEPLYIRSIGDDRTSNISDKESDKIKEKSDYIQIESGTDFITEFQYAPNINDSLKQNIVLKEESTDFADQMNVTKVDSSRQDTTKTYTIAPYDYQDGKRVLYVDSTYIKMRSTTYRRAFHVASFSAHLDKSLIFTKYQTYGGNFGSLSNPELGGMFTVVLKDRMEDHRFTGGLRLNADFGMTYLAKYENLKRRLDWGFTGFVQNSKFTTMVGIRTGPSIIATEIPSKGRLSIFQANLTYPLNRTTSIRGNFGIREDRTTLKSTELVGLLVTDLLEYYSMNRIEYVYDNTKAPALNIMNGMRAKVFGEFYYKFKAQNEFYGDANGTINNKTGGFYNFGFDIRYYKKIYRDMIFAVRGAGAHAGGGQQIMYSMGGVDNAFNAKNNTLLQPTLKNTYAFQSLVTNMRGYAQNSRNGNTFLVTNLELRMPVFSTLFDNTPSSLFLKNLQLVAFTDIGSAWEGLFPDKNINRSNTFYYPDKFDPQVIVTVPYPIPSQLAMGYGIGARLYLYSYFVRIDYARNIENKGMFHISLGYDF